MKWFKKTVSLLVSAMLLLSAGSVSAVSGSSLPQQVVSELELTSGVTLADTVTREQFSKILVNASPSYRGNAGTSVTYQMFNDVQAGSDYSSSIYVAVQNGWMSGYLGGWFRPSQAVTLREAANGFLALLGYTDSDFQGNQYQGRQTAYYSTGLLDTINSELDSALTSADCIQMLYNLMKADTKQGTMFGSSFGCTLDSDDEIDLSALVGSSSNSIKGPVVVEESLEDTIPFDLEKATVFIDGACVDESDYDSVGEGSVVYYSSRTKTVWAYLENMETGTVTGIGYDLSGSMTPTALYVEGTEYRITDEDLQDELADGISLRVGDEVTILYDTVQDTSGEEYYSLRDFSKE